MSADSGTESTNGSSNSNEAQKPQIEPLRLPTVEEIRGQDIWNNCAVRSVVSGVMEWMDYSCTDALPSYLGLLQILIYKVYVDGMPTMSSQERKATLREFYVVIYPSLKQLEGDLIELMEDENERTERSEILSRNRVEEKRRFLVEILREMMNVVYAWKLAPRWYCPIVATPCASAASMIVTTCCLARDALDLLRERKDGSDIVISDVKMPDMDGFKLLELVGLEMDLPVIMMSIDGETSRVMKGVQHGWSM